jgi:TRAP-type C4-dicarboxylate transport system substrate-binding protein
MQLQGANIVCSNGLESMTDYVKDIGAVAGPFLFKTYDEIPVLINSDWMNEIESNCRDYGVMGLSYNWITGFRSFIGNTIIEEPEDFKGLQLRAANTTLMGLIMKSLGATHLTSNWNEVYTGLSNGTYAAWKGLAAAVLQQSL